MSTYLAVTNCQKTVRLFGPLCTCQCCGAFSGPSKLGSLDSWTNLAVNESGLDVVTDAVSVLLV